MAQDLDVIVIGLGIVGSAALASCAQRGVRSLGIEQFEMVHDLGSSHGESRIFRIAYYEHPDYVPLLQRALERWGDVEREAGRTLLHRCGGVWFGRPDAPLIAETAAAARVHGLQRELITDSARIRSRFPAFTLPDHYAAFFEEPAGALLAEESVRTFIDLARSRGASVRENTPVTGWTASDDHVAVHAGTDTFRAARVIVTAGAWAGALVPELSGALTVTRQPVAWLEVREPARFAPDRFPCWAFEKNAHAFYYGFPLVHGGSTIKVSIHEVREQADPAAVDRSVSAREIAELKDAADRIFPGMIGDCARACICLYTNSPDGHFLIDRHPAHERIVIAAGFSGHGFKFAPVLGDALADLALESETDLPISFLSLDRLKRGTT